MPTKKVARPQSAPAPKKAQPLEVFEHDEALLTLETAEAISGMSRRTLYRKAAAGELDLVHVSTRCTRVRAGVLRAFLAAQG